MLAASLALSGCASIPLTTALRLSSLFPQHLAHVDPAQVRVKVSVPLGYEINIRAARLTLVLTGPSGHHSAAMGLAVLGTSQGLRSRGWFRPSVHVSTVMLGLDPQGVQKLRKLQQYVLAGDAKGFEFSLVAPLAKVPPGAKQVTIWAALRLRTDEPFMPLIDGATFKFGSTTMGS
jgi:hypothetical protein